MMKASVMAPRFGFRKSPGGNELIPRPRHSEAAVEHILKRRAIQPRLFSAKLFSQGCSVQGYSAKAVQCKAIQPRLFSARLFSQGCSILRVARRGWSGLCSECILVCNRSQGSAADASVEAWCLRLEIVASGRAVNNSSNSNKLAQAYRAATGQWHDTHVMVVRTGQLTRATLQWWLRQAPLAPRAAAAATAASAAPTLYQLRLTLSRGTAVQSELGGQGDAKGGDKGGGGEGMQRGTIKGVKEGKGCWQGEGKRSPKEKA
eukprot:352743-Chlamydomonas_euryale.AAC.9